MADKSKIQWTDATWQVTRGCSVVSPGCANCYAMKQAYRLASMGQEKYKGLTMGSNAGPVWNGQVRLVTDDELLQPTKWKRGRMIFVDSMSDLFHASVPFAWIARVFAVMQLTPQHRFQVLTKRIERAREFLEDPGTRQAIAAAAAEISRGGADDLLAADGAWPLPNVWLGTSVEDQRRANERIPALLASVASLRFVSIEPLLGPVDLRASGSNIQLGTFTAAGRVFNGIDWVIVGGESGPNARPMHPAWAQGIQRQCTAMGVPFFFKQWGAWAPIPTAGVRETWLHSDGTSARFMEGGAAGLWCVGKERAGAVLGGREWREWPSTP